MEQLLEFLSSFENGATEDEICSKFHRVKKNDLVVLLNEMIRTNKIQVISTNYNTDSGLNAQLSRNKIRYKIVENKLADYEGMIMAQLAQSGSNGMWLREIKNKTNIPHNMILKLLRNMESECKIRSIKSVKNNRKIYMLYGITPAEEVTGGVWFSENDVDGAFVSKVAEMAHSYCYRKEEGYMLNSVGSLSTEGELRDFLNVNSFEERDLSTNDVSTIVDILVSEGRMERIRSEEGDFLRSIEKSYFLR